MTLITVGDAVIHKETFGFPHPPIVVNSVRNKDHIKTLADIQKEFGDGCLYLYLDLLSPSRDFYMGETSSSFWSRHSKHMKQDWYHKMKEPLILVVQNRLTEKEEEWSTNARRLMEARVVQSFHSFGFKAINRENSTWKNLNLAEYPKAETWEASVNVLKTFVSSYTGINLLEDSPVNIASPSSAGNDASGAKLIARRRNTEVFGTELSDGSIHIDKALNIYPHCTNSAKSPTRERHAQILAEAKLNKGGTYDWEGSIISSKRTSYLSAFCAAETADIWKQLT